MRELIFVNRRARMDPIGDVEVSLEPARYLMSERSLKQPRTSIALPRIGGATARAVLVAALFWLVSMRAYYALVAALDLERGYDGAPILFTAYYLGWTAIALLVFRRVIAASVARATVARETLIMVPILAGFAVFVIYVMPFFPKVSPLRAPSEPPEFMFASAWYYLPKSADILFQQTLVAALILTAARAGYSLRVIAAGTALAFGGLHLMLAFAGFTALYVARFSLSAAVMGAVLPYLYLRCSRGLRWAYTLHCGFYALDATLTHFILAAPPWA